MLRNCLILLLALIPVPAAAGTRATYGTTLSRPIVVEVADNGDISATLPGSRRLAVIGGRAFIVEERLTGPLVTRLDDLADLAAHRQEPAAEPGAPAGSAPPIVQRGTAEVGGRSGRAWFIAGATGRQAERPLAVIGDDRALTMLGPAMRRVFEAQLVLSRSEGGVPPSLGSLEEALLRLLDQGVPLSFFDWNLRTVEQVPIDAASIALPAEPESAEGLRRRRAAEAQENESPPNPGRAISRAIFAEGRLWLLAEQGGLSSLAEGERARRIEDPGGKVLDLCAAGDSPLALTGERAGARWTVRRLEGGAWRTVRAISRSGDTPIALSCGAGGEMLLTSSRLIDLSGASPALHLAQPLQPPLFVVTAHVTPEAAWLGINVGEWGGGLLRIDRRSGEVRTIERNATGGLCDGPINTACDPVNGIATIPWRPRCVAAAIGLIHLAAHGRIASICPQGIEQLFVASDAIDPGNPRNVAEAASGGIGSVAFFGLAATRGALLAIGHDGLYRIEASGAGTRRPWPRFAEVDGVLVSFALPDVVLVMTAINGHMSLSGITPLMAVR